jgi:hypothetical protein
LLAFVTAYSLTIVFDAPYAAQADNLVPRHSHDAYPISAVWLMQ